MYFLSAPRPSTVSIPLRPTGLSPRFFGARLSSALLVLSLFVGGPALAADEFAAVSATVFDYFEGINELSRDRLQRAFDESATLKSVDGSGSLVVEPIAVAMGRWMQGDPAQRHGKILAIDFSDGPIARVVFDYDGAYVDFLTLAKLQGQWKIIDKAFIRKK